MSQEQRKTLDLPHHHVLLHQPLTHCDVALLSWKHWEQSCHRQEMQFSSPAASLHHFLLAAMLPLSLPWLLHLPNFQAPSPAP